MLFNLFGKKEEKGPERLFKDVVWIDTEAKNQGLLNIFKANPDVLFVAWFPDAAASFRAFGTAHGIAETQVKEARQLHQHDVQGKQVVFLEHHPLHPKEVKLAEDLHLGPTEVHGALDEAIFVYFGSEKMMPFVKMLGFKASDPIEHPFVTASVIKAQEKMEKKVVVEQSANSLAEWLKKNLD